MNTDLPNDPNEQQQDHGQAGSVPEVSRGVPTSDSRQLQKPNPSKRVDPSKPCQELVIVGWSRHFDEEYGDGNVYRQCGTYYSSDLVLCDPHIDEYNKKHPQGWESYPGDICKHGVYVGGVMEDYMCGRCEQGDD